MTQGAPATPQTPPVAVVGAGPAGRAIAAALAERGAGVVLVDPDPDRPFPNTYGLWADEADALDLHPAVARRCTTTRISLDADRSHQLNRGYARLSPAALKALLTDRCLQHGVEVREARVASASHGAEGSLLLLEAGDPIEASVIIDASGHHPVLLERPEVDEVAHQVAFGLTLRVPPEAIAHDVAVLMDYSPVDDADRGHQGPPTFLYAIPEADDLLFVEETVLATTADIDPSWLQARLVRRLAALGIEGEVVEVERCRFPMGLPLPHFDQPVVGFGAAAGLVHPATGYMLGRTLTLAAPLADALVDGLLAGERGAVLARRGWDALWPEPRLASHRLHRFGLDVLLGFGPEQLRGFFHAFFLGEPHHWRAYLDANTPADLLAEAMLGMAVRLPVGLVRSLATEALRRPAILPQLGSHLPRLLLPRRSSWRLRSTS